MHALSRCRRLLAVGAVVVLGACGASGPMAASSQPDHAIAGPQGGKGQFVVACAYSHASLDDPIVFPGQPGASHRHVFFGNVTTDAASTIASLDSGGTSCEQQLDRAAALAPGNPAPRLVLAGLYTTCDFHEKARQAIDSIRRDLPPAVLKTKYLDVDLGLSLIHI